MSRAQTLSTHPNILTSGTYTPTITGVTNVSSTTAYSANYMRVGNTVTVSGMVAVTTTLPGTATIGISLPVASNLSGGSPNCVGTTNNASGAYPGVIYGDAGNKRAQVIFGNTVGGGMNHFFHFTYQVN